MLSGPRGSHQNPPRPYKIANLIEQGKEPGAQEHWRQAHDILASMVAEGLFVSQGDLAFLDRLKSKLDG